MENQISPLLEGIAAQYNLQTRLFNNVLNGITDEQAHVRMGGNTNHMAWMAGHLVSTRYSVVNGMSVVEAEPFADLFANQKGLDEQVTYPAIAEQVKYWNHITPMFMQALQHMPEAALLADGPAPVPTGKRLIDFIAFLAHHEAYTIGQMGIIRRYVNMPAMSYSI
jgi:hypothetical protein